MDLFIFKLQTFDDRHTNSSNLKLEEKRGKKRRIKRAGRKKRKHEENIKKGEVWERRGEEGK